MGTSRVSTGTVQGIVVDTIETCLFFVQKLKYFEFLLLMIAIDDE
jgi:hypothetical protein